MGCPEGVLQSHNTYMIVITIQDDAEMWSQCCVTVQRHAGPLLPRR